MKMMTNLFSTFDPCTGWMSMNWLSLFSILVMPKKFWAMNNPTMNMMMTMMNSTIKETESNTKIKGMSIMSNSMIMTIMTVNMMGLIPYVFTPSAHLTFSLTLSLPMWVSFMIYGWLKKTHNMMEHLVPMSTPSMLMPFMVMIETISNMIRPGSLAVRLSANMIAGHMIMSLLGNSTSSLLKMATMAMLYLILMMFESAVAVIQSYVFVTLSSLYSSEI
uniref:ATP synthase subunit a n=1 Tax=Kalasha nativa TaxID=2800228 RepID=A0A7T6YDM7_9HEMI|nr:ATP synthase F0 subunit 6 [Kalasha nativa]QQK57711.1 ATP synthase F0 subunit 6 [Kalasha nativa]